MNGPQHYKEAERLVDAIHHAEEACLTIDDLKITMLAAQVHATLALAAAQGIAMSGWGGSPETHDAWTDAAS